jgi:hypothetical protein
MGLRKCPECKQKISTSALSCPHCGQPEPFGPPGSPSRSSSGSSGCVGCLGLVAVVWLAGTFASDDRSGSANKSGSDPSNVTVTWNDSTVPGGTTHTGQVGARQRLDSLESLLALNYSRMRAVARSQSEAAARSVRDGQRLWLAARDSACGHPSIAEGLEGLAEDSTIMCFAQWDSSRLAALDSLLAQ